MSDKDKNILLEARDLSFRYGPGKPMILERIDFQLKASEIMGISGPNGSGKTTLFKCLTGLLKIDAGSIYLESRSIRTEEEFYGLRRKVGFVLQDADDQLFFPTVLEDLAFGPLNLGLGPREARQRAMESLDLTGLKGFEERRTDQLSGGEKKLAAIAAILAMKPTVLLLDEPLNGLDNEAMDRIGKLIDNLPCAKIIISHDYGFLAAHCGTILKMEKGRLQ